MDKKKIVALMLAMSLGSLVGSVTAEPAANNLNFCTKRSGSISSGTVAARQEKVIYGPYIVTCGTTSHHFNIRGASGQTPVVVQRLQHGSWSAVTGRVYDPSGRFGSGTFRVVVDNRQSDTSISYTGTYSVPM
ncbi:MAG: hypothetical protein PW896_13720 [Pseudomonas sp.]|jgi:hypothetical protein|uniref:hypothetical protein n=1 Tax=Pseudomonas sp. TaxID=306 RepID=UPI00239270EA|nr:hypothetical protein [Pseudomonas sp.]MDE1196197.1 hypothetical protein [Pseudomonas sp.]